MKKIFTSILAIFIAFAANAQVSGIAFRDHNGNGILEAVSEPGIPNVLVKVFNAYDFLLGQTLTDASGNYSFSSSLVPATTPIRVEFSAPTASTGLQFSTNSSMYGSNVQFSTAPSVGINVAMSSLKDYIPASNNNADVFMVRMYGLTYPLAGSMTDTALFTFKENSNSTTPLPVKIAASGQIGSTWGVAYHKQSKTVFASTFFRRYAGFGPGGQSAIYKANAGTDNVWGTSDDAVGTFIKLDDYFGANSTGPYAFGSPMQPSGDTDLVAKLAYGDIEMSADGKSLFAANLHDNKIYTIPVNAAGTAPALGTITASLPIPTPASCIGTMHIFGMTVRGDDGKVFVSAVCEPSNGIVFNEFIPIYVWGFNPTTNTWDAAPIIDYSYRFYQDRGPCCFIPWPQHGLYASYSFQMMMMGLEIDQSGNFLSLTYNNRRVFNFSAEIISSIRNTGNIVRFCYDGTSWNIEDKGVSCGLVGAGVGSNQGPGADASGMGGGNFYNDLTVGGTNASVLGSTMQIPGRSGLMTGFDDPLIVYTGGVITLNKFNGAQDVKYQATDIAPPIVQSFSGKQNPLGDLEYAADLAPIEVGNRVWFDTDADGIQDPNENGIAGLTLDLYDLGLANVVASVTTDVNGNWLFSSAAGTSTASAIYNFPLKPKYGYIVKVRGGTSASSENWDNVTGKGQRLLADYILTPKDIVGNGKIDWSDNDAYLQDYAGTTPTIEFQTGDYGVNNYNLDFGFTKPLATIGDRVWLDENKDGNSYFSEPGVSGVAVSLYLNGADGLPGTDDDVPVRTTTTDAFGRYIFDRLEPTNKTNATTIAQTSYNVRVTPPANYVFTTQLDLVDDNLLYAASGFQSDVNPIGQSYSIELDVAEINLRIDAGLIFKDDILLTSSVGDRVWFDGNNNGNQDAGERGVAGITVTLFDASGNTVAITTTDATGFYIFNRVANGTYSVGFTNPGGTLFTNNIGGVTTADASTNSDVNAATGRTNTFTISTPSVITGIDAGLINDLKGAIGDFVWNDLNKNGIQEAGEPGIPGATVKLRLLGADGVIGGADDATQATTTTDANGYYIFTGLDPIAKFYIAVTNISGYAVSPQDVIALNPARDIKDNDFVNGAALYPGHYITGLRDYRPGVQGQSTVVTRDMSIDLGVFSNTANLNKLGDKVWNDVNNNGTQDGTEAGIAGVTVRLLNSTGVAVNNPATGKPYVIVTDAQGMYQFVDLVDGNYIVEFANIPNGFSFTTQDALGVAAPGSAGDSFLDSDGKTTTGRTGIISVDATSASAVGIVIVNVDAGIKQGEAAGTASLGNKVWYDMNNNGIQDVTEMGIAGVKVTLMDEFSSIVNVPGTSVQYVVYTNGKGEYLFNGLPAGDYRVQFSKIPAGFSSSVANVGANDLLDADASYTGTAIATTSATTAVYTLQKGEDNMSVDMGLIPSAGTNSIGDFAWYDVNNNGKQDASEVGLPGVIASLYLSGVDGLAGTTDDVFVGTTTTNDDGRYGFFNLPNGAYNVSFTNPPDGYFPAIKSAAGTTTSDDSDIEPSIGRVGFVSGSVSLTGGINNTSIDAGYVSSRAMLGNYVWLDSNGDGIQDAAELPISGALVYLYAADGVTSAGATTVTDANGKYLFPNLGATDASGAPTHAVGFRTLPTNLGFTKQNTPGDNSNNTNSDADLVTGKSAPIKLVYSEVDLTIDAGVKPDVYASVGDFVWDDGKTAGDGIQSPNEPGIPGILVTLYNSSNVAVGSAITDGNGRYRIDKIIPGTGYYIIFGNGAFGTSFTLYNGNVSTTDPTLGSDAALGTGRTPSFDLLPGQYLQTVDAGIVGLSFLPIKLLSFTATPEGSKVNLTWKVEEQVRVDKYEVEYSTDGVNFKLLTSVNADAAKNAYTTLHNTPVAGFNYYRIKIIENNSSYNYSDIRKVNFGKGSTVLVYPNPAKGFINITLTGSMTNKAATISVIGVGGKVVSQQNTTSTSQTEVINVANLANGTYIIRVATDNEIINKTIIVLN
jgi:hypothetical protein